MLRISDRYIIRSFILSFAICAAALVGLFMVIDTFSNLSSIVSLWRKAGGPFYHLPWLVIKMNATRMPLIFYELGSVLTLSAAMFTVARLKKSNEITPLLASGVSIHRVLWPVFLMALAVTAAQVADMEFVIPRFGEYIYDWERVRNGASGQRRFNALVEDGYGNVMFTAQYEIKSKIQYNAQMTRYWAPAGGWPPMIILNAQEARWQQSPRPGWTYLRGTAIKYDEERNVVSQTSFENDGFFVPLEAKAARVPDYEVKTDISPSKLESEEIDILYRPTLYLIQYMREHGLRADITFDINRRIASPLSNIILLLVGLPFVLKREVKSPFLGMVLAVFITAAYFAASLICENFALEGRVLTPLTGAWAPIIIFAPVGVLLFDTVES